MRRRRRNMINIRSVVLKHATLNMNLGSLTGRNIVIESVNNSKRIKIVSLKVIISKRKKQTKKSRCFICDSEEHLANRCPDKNKNKKNKEKANIVADIGYDFEFVETNIELEDDESIYSICSEYIEDEYQNLLEDSSSSSSDDEIDLSQLDLSQIEFNCMNIEECQHIWNKEGFDSIACKHCGGYPDNHKRYKCKTCKIEVCVFCLKTHYVVDLIDEQKNKDQVELRNQMSGLDIEDRIRIVRLEKEILRLESQHEIERLKAQLLEMHNIEEENRELRFQNSKLQQQLSEKNRPLKGIEPMEPEITDEYSNTIQEYTGLAETINTIVDSALIQIPCTIIFSSNNQIDLLAMIDT